MFCLYLGFFQLSNVTGHWCITEFLEVGILKTEPSKKIINLDKTAIIFYTFKNKNELHMLLEKHADAILDFIEKKIIKFINTSKNITIKQHQLDLIPGIGNIKKNKIIEEKNNHWFEDFEDFQNRINTNLKKLLKPLLIKELSTKIDVFNYVLK